MKRPRPGPWVVVGGLLAGCADVTTVEEARRPVDPPPEVYATFWQEAEACSGLSGDFGRVRWFWIDAFPRSFDTAGRWSPGHEITIKWEFRFARPIVMHEILHDLLDGNAGHTDPAWSRCPVAGG